MVKPNKYDEPFMKMSGQKKKDYERAMLGNVKKPAKSTQKIKKSKKK